MLLEKVMKKIIFIIMVISLFPAKGRTSIYIPLDDEIYDILMRLEAQGYIKSGLLTTKPLSKDEISRLLLEAKSSPEDKSILIKSLLTKQIERFQAEKKREIDYVKPVDNIVVRYIYAGSSNRELFYNNEGEVFEKGNNFALGMTSQAKLGSFSFYVNPQLRISEQGQALSFKRVYSVINISNFDIKLGRDSAWWGPGYHGAILLSNNPKPFTSLLLTNPNPILLPWLFRYLGPFRFNFFLTRLEEERTIPKPYFWGLRFNFKPTPYTEIGLQRTALLGGKGRPEGFKTWLKSFTGKGENDPGEPGDQRAGFDIKLTLPFKRQPIQIYLEAVGEDEAGYLPYKWAYLGGLYLPRLLNYEKLSFRAEYATTRISGHPGVWYTHHLYGKDAYTYKGRIIGHHMGTDARDYFIELSYLLSDNGKISLFYDKEEHNLFATKKGKKDEYGLKFNREIKKGLRINLFYQYINRNDGFKERSSNQLIVGVDYAF